MSETITMTKDELSEFAQETVKATLAELGVKGYPSQSGRVYRKQMIEIIGLHRYREAVENGWLSVSKHNPEAVNSKVFAAREDWERFLKIHTNR